MVKFLKWRALYKLGCCLSRLVSRVTSLRLARFPSATRNITLLPYVFSVNCFCRFRRLFLPVHLLFLTALLGHSGAVAGDVEFQDD